MFVLRKVGGKGGDFEIWQPATGESWHSTKPADRQGICGRRANRAAGRVSASCPLVNVRCAFSGENVWVCTQTVPSGGNALSLTYDFDEAKWPALFTTHQRESLTKTGTIEPLCETVVYKPPPHGYQEELNRQIQDYLETQFLDYRTSGAHGRKQMVAGVQKGELHRMLYDHLEKLEDYRCTHRKRASTGEAGKFPLECHRSSGSGSDVPAPISEDVLESIRDQVERYCNPGGGRGEGNHMYGVPLHMQYTDNHSVWDRCLNTDLLWLGDERTKFYVVVRTFVYPPAIVSVWVFLLAVGISH